MKSPVELMKSGLLLIALVSFLSHANEVNINIQSEKTNISHIATTITLSSKMPAKTIEEETEKAESGSAEVEIAFVFGTAFLADIWTRPEKNSDTTHYGPFGVGYTWHGTLPQFSYVAFRPEGFGIGPVTCFQVLKAGKARIAVWGIANDPKWSNENPLVLNQQSYEECAKLFDF